MEYTELKVEDYPDFLRLYNESFPENERRIFKDAEHLANFIKMKGGKFHAFAAKDGELFLGFLSYWKFEGYVYVEHFAVANEHRGRRLGTGMLEHLFRTVSPDVLIEVEKPDTDEAARRIKFYERNGFRLRGEIDYIQPPYSDAQKSVPMDLMTHGDVKLRSHADIEPMLREVYGQNHTA